MTQIYEIEPVAASRYAEAMRFIAGGQRRDADSNARTQALIQVARSRRPEAVEVWWGRQDKRIAAAAMVIANPGRVGMLFHSHSTDPGVQAEALPAVIQHVSRHFLDRGMSFVQTLLESPGLSEVPMLQRAGYEFLAELVYMRKELTQANSLADPRESEHQWLTYDQFDEAYLARVIQSTYEQSLDCPGLSGLRDIHDVVASHKSAGVFCPQAWWIPTHNGWPTGCILVNDYPHNRSAEVVYLGVVPSFRGRGLAKTMLSRAARAAMERGQSGMTLAVDAANVYAYRVYQSQWFNETQRRFAYALMDRDWRRKAREVRPL